MGPAIQAATESPGEGEPSDPDLAKEWVFEAAASGTIVRLQQHGNYARKVAQ